MNTKTTWGIAVCLLWPLGAGCSHDPGVIRGQNPAAPFASEQQVVPPTQAASAGGWGTHPPHVAAAGHGVAAGPGCVGCQHGHHASVHAHDLSLSAHHSHQHRGLMKLFGDHGDGFLHDEPWYPTHRHWFSYHQPRDLVYPPSNQPASVVQYPYYTVKGPDCFFLQ